MYPFRKKLHPGVLVPIQFLPNSVQEDVVDVDLIEREGSGVSPPPTWLHVCPGSHPYPQSCFPGVFLFHEAKS